MRKYAWQSIEDEMVKVGNAEMRKQLEELRDEYFPRGELVIAKNFYGDGKVRLAWKFDVYAVEPLSCSKIYVNAIDGKILLSDTIIKHAGNPGKNFSGNNSPFYNHSFNPAGGYNNPTYRLTSEMGTAHTRYAGIRNIYTTRLSVPLTGTNDPNNTSAQLQYSGVDPRVPVIGSIDVFILKDDTRGSGIETYDMNGVGELPLSIPALQTQALAFVDKDNIWKNETAAGTNEDHLRDTTSNDSRKRLFFAAPFLFGALLGFLPE